MEQVCLGPSGIASVIKPGGLYIDLAPVRPASPDPEPIWPVWRTRFATASSNGRPRSKAAGSPPAITRRSRVRAPSMPPDRVGLKHPAELMLPPLMHRFPIATCGGSRAAPSSASAHRLVNEQRLR